MAVRDGQPLNEARRGLPWRETLGHAPAVALVSGLLLYAYLSLCYHLFTDAWASIPTTWVSATPARWPDPPAS
jgi:hypothetical protein